MRFEAKQPEVEFQTGHALWALHAAGIPASKPQVAKGLSTCSPAAAIRGVDGPTAIVRELPHALSRDADGDIGAELLLPSRRTCESRGILRISAFVSQDLPIELLGQLDDVWDAPSPEVRKQIERLPHRTMCLCGQAAMEALDGPESTHLCTRKGLEIRASWSSERPPGRCGNLTAEGPILTVERGC